MDDVISKRQFIDKYVYFKWINSLQIVNINFDLLLSFKYLDNWLSTATFQDCSGNVICLKILS